MLLNYTLCTNLLQEKQNICLDVFYNKKGT
jgi:hypothetical protein